MSSVQTNSEAVRGLLSLRRDSKVPVNAPHKVAGAPSEQLSHAWSIGTTRAAMPAETPANLRRDECPPEVYIG